MTAYAAGVKLAKTELGIKDTDKVQKKTRFAGMAIHLDQPKGSVREWHDDKGNLIWSAHYPHDYGFFPKVLGADGDHLDAYVGPHSPTAAPVAYVMDKLKKDGKTFDEHKVFLGFKSPEEIKREVTDAWANRTQVGQFREMSLTDLKAQVRAGKFTPPK